MLEKIKNLTKISNYDHQIRKFPKTRSFVTDTCDRGKSKNIIYMFFDADITDIRKKLKQQKIESGNKISLTTYILHAFAHNINNFPNMNSYRKGRNKLILIEDVDVSVMIEKEIMGQNQPIHYVIRAANKKKLNEIQDELLFAKNSPYEVMVNRPDRYFFEKVPRIFRKLLWKLSKKDPRAMKDYSGTVGLTNMGMFGEGFVTIMPLTPMTSTLAIGTIEEKLKLINGKIENREFINMTLSVDHNIIDGSPMMRFVTAMKKIMQDNFQLISGGKDDDTNSNKDNFEIKQASNFQNQFLLNRI